MDLGNLPLLDKVKEYRRRAQEVKTYLDQHPDEWPRFQAEVSSSIDHILLDILNFEKENLNGNEAQVYRLKKLFEQRLRKYFLHGELVRRAFEKPYGYAGDFTIIDAIYADHAHTVGFDRLWDNYFLSMAIAIAVRNRKEDFKRIVRDFIKEQQGREVKIMNLACGPGRDVKELIEEDGQFREQVIFDCYDYDENALSYMRHLLNGLSHRVNFVRANAVRLALKKEIASEIPVKYDLIYSSGLFDYLDARVAIRLVSNLRDLLQPGGLLVISNVRDKFSNRSAYLMEWITDWNLIYRTEEEFKTIFLDSGFPDHGIKILFEKQKIMQYGIVKKEL